MSITSLTQITEKNRVFDAIGASFGIISFKPDGTIIDANENFLRLMGYRVAEIAGRHHSMFLSAAERDAPAYAEFWQRLRSGAFCSGGSAETNGRAVIAGHRS